MTSDSSKKPTGTFTQHRGMGPGVNSLRFGVNYVPSRSWWHIWNAWDRDEISEDLDAIASLGADHIRVMVLWPYFQPNRTWVSPAHLDRLRELMELAEARGLDVCIAALTGWLSGQRYRFDYQGLDHAEFYTDPAWREVQHRLLEALASTVADAKNFIGIDIGNEINECWRTDSAKGDIWWKAVKQELDARLPDAIHVNGVDHKPWFRESCFSPQCLAQTQTIVPIHAWVYFTGALQRGPHDGPAALRLVPGMAELVRAHAGDAAKPIWCQEFGASKQWIAEPELPDFFRATMLSAINGGVSWLTVWASHDVHPRFHHQPLEYDLGLLDVENKIKPQGKVFQELAAHYRGQPRKQPVAQDSSRPTPAHQTEAVWEWILSS